MKTPALKFYLVLSLIATMTVACAPDRNKKDRLTRISGGRSKVVANTPAETTTIETQTTDCRITDSPELDKTFRKQSFCDGLEVSTKIDGKIELGQKHSINNTINALALKLEAAKLEDKKVSIEWTSIKSTNQDNKDVLQLAFKLPHKKSSIEGTSVGKTKIEIFINDAQLGAEEFSMLYPENTEDVIVRLNDATKIENINFKLKINYTLK